MRGEDIRDFMQPHYILLCVRAYVEEVPNAIVQPFFMAPGCIPDVRERFSKDEISVPRTTVARANERIATSLNVLAFKSDDCVQGNRSPSRSEILR